MHRREPRGFGMASIGRREMNARLTANRPSRIFGCSGFSRVSTMLGIATAIGVSMAVMKPAVAQDIAAPADPVANAAFEALSKNCARCHQDGKLVSRERPAKNFGFVLDLDKLAHNPKFVLPGNSNGSLLFRQIVDKEMPYDVVYEGASPDISADDITAIAKWIDSLGAVKVASAGPGTVTDAPPPNAGAQPDGAAPPAPGPAPGPAPTAAAPGCGPIITQENVISLIAADINKITPRS